MSSSTSSSVHEIILTSSPEGPITAYNPSSGVALAHFSGSRSPRQGLASVGKSFIAASHISPTTGSGSIHLYNWWSSTALHNLPVPEPVAPLVTTADGLYLFTGGISGTIYVISIPSGDIIQSFSTHKKPVSCLKINEDGSLLISGGDDGTIVTVPIFQLVDDDKKNSSDLTLQRFSAHDDSVTAIVSFMGLCNSIMISSSKDCTCKFWRLLNGTHLRSVTFPCEIMGLTLNSTETEFFAAGSDGLVYKGSLSGGEFSALGQKHNSMVVTLAMTNGGKNLVSAGEDGSVYIWDVETEQVIMVLGNEMGISISDMVVVNGIGDRVAEKASFYGGCHGFYESYSEEMINRSGKDSVELENVMKVAAKDKRKAIDMLESAIAIYERLLEMILKEAMGGGCKNGKVNEKDDM